jgi:hypothetical protein
MTLASSVGRVVTRRSTVLVGAALVAATAMALPQRAHAQTDPRVGLKTGFADAGVAARNIELVAHGAKPDAFMNKKDLGDFGYLNSDLAFSGKYVFQGSFHGFQIWDVSNIKAPKLRVMHECPGGQGDPSVYGKLLFISVEMPNGRIDCGSQSMPDTIDKARFRGVRIYDISDIDHPKQVAAVQTCRGSHTHTLVTDPNDKQNIYVYVSGTSSVRPAGELAGCSAGSPDKDPNTSLFRIEIIKVPLAAPQNAKVIAAPRIFADAAGNIAGLQKGSSPAGGQQTSTTDQCHDITAYVAIGLAAGACSGNGILLDIRNPANPKRIAEVSDPNFAYWHSATFSNDGSKVLFSDEWGGGMAPRCRSTDRPEWGADAIFTIANGKMSPASYYKIPAPQTESENCVAHNGSLIPVPGRDILVQGWYQGGLSVVDFTDASHPMEIAFFDRGPITDKLALAGIWCAYWYNGNVIASEIGRGLDILQLTPSAQLSQNEIDAAKLVTFAQLNVQMQPKFVWPAKFVVARAYLDQLARNGAVPSAWTSHVKGELAQAEQLSGAAQKAVLTMMAAQLENDAGPSADVARVRALAATVAGLAAAAR